MGDEVKIEETKRFETTEGGENAETGTEGEGTETPTETPTEEPTDGDGSEDAE